MVLNGLDRSLKQLLATGKLIQLLIGQRSASLGDTRQLLHAGSHGRPEGTQGHQLLIELSKVILRATPQVNRQVKTKGVTDVSHVALSSRSQRVKTLGRLVKSLGDTSRIHQVLGVLANVSRAVEAVPVDGLVGGATGLTEGLRGRSGVNLEKSLGLLLANRSSSHCTDLAINTRATLDELIERAGHFLGHLNVHVGVRHVTIQVTHPVGQGAEGPLHTSRSSTVTNPAHHHVGEVLFSLDIPGPSAGAVWKGTRTTGHGVNVSIRQTPAEIAWKILVSNVASSNVGKLMDGGINISAFQQTHDNTTLISKRGKPTGLTSILHEDVGGLASRDYFFSGCSGCARYPSGKDFKRSSICDNKFGVKEGTDLGSDCGRDPSEIFKKSLSSAESSEFIEYLWLFDDLKKIPRSEKITLGDVLKDVLGSHTHTLECSNSVSSSPGPLLSLSWHNSHFSRQLTHGRGERRIVWSLCKPSLLCVKDSLWLKPLKHTVWKNLSHVGIQNNIVHSASRSLHERRSLTGTRLHTTSGKVLVQTGGVNLIDKVINGSVWVGFLKCAEPTKEVVSNL